MGVAATSSRPRQPLCFRCNYPRRPALCIICVKPKRSEATWRLVFLHVSSCDDGSVSGTADSQRTEIIAFHAPRFSRAHLAGGVVTWSTRDNVWLSLSRRVYVTLAHVTTCVSCCSPFQSNNAMTEIFLTSLAWSDNLTVDFQLNRQYPATIWVCVCSFAIATTMAYFVFDKAATIRTQ